MTSMRPPFPDDQIACIDVHGADARTFLNGQFTHNLVTLTVGDSRFGAFCTPKGRALALASISATPDGLVLATESELADALLATLSRYVMRAKVTFGAPREPQPAGVSARTLIDAGLPRVVAATSGEFVPQMLNLDLLDGVSFAKGCYTGQEIVARTQNLGRIKRRMLPFSHASIAPPLPGAALVNEAGEKVGTVVSATSSGGGCALLAVVRLATLDAQLLLDGAESVPLERGMLPYRVPELED